MSDDLCVREATIFHSSTPSASLTAAEIVAMRSAISLGVSTFEVEDEDEGEKGEEGGGDEARDMICCRARMLSNARDDLSPRPLAMRTCRNCAEEGAVDVDDDVEANAEREEEEEEEEAGAGVLIAVRTAAAWKIGVNNTVEERCTKLVSNSTSSSSSSSRPL